jgi:tetratricopeptide (TPR) repeat protein
VRPQPLSEAAVAELARRAGRSPAGLREVTGGNPLLVTQVLAADDAGVPLTVRDLVLAALAGLPADAREVARLVAVVPTRAELWLLEEALGPAPAAVERCVAAGLLVVDEEAVGFRHELLRQAVEGSLSALGRRELNRRVLRALDGARDGVVDVARLVHHAREAGDVEAVLRYAPEAARQAAAVSAHREAVGHYRAALAHAGRLPPLVRAELLEGYSFQAYVAGLAQEALKARQAALGIREAEGSSPEQLGESLRWLSRLSWWAGRRKEAEAAAARAIAVLEHGQPGHQLAMAYSNQAQLDMLAHRTEAALAWGSRAIELARRLGDRETLTHALNNIGSARLQVGDQRGRADLEQAFEVAVAAGLEDHAARALVNLASVDMEFRDYGHARWDLDRAVAFTVQHDLAGNGQYMLGMRARLRLDLGDWAAPSRTPGPPWPSWSNGGRDPERWTRWWCWVCCRRAAATRTPAARWRRPRRVPFPPTSCSGSGRWPPRGPSTPGWTVPSTAPRPRPPPGSRWRSGSATPGWPGSWPAGCGGLARCRRSRRWRPSRTGCCWPATGGRPPAPGMRWDAPMSRR